MHPPRGGGAFQGPWRLTLSPEHAILYVALIIGAITDIRTHLIPNWLTVTVMAAGLIAGGVLGGTAGLTAAFIGLAAAFVIHFALWQLGLEGAGDAKLMMGVGAFLGWETMIEATLWRYVFHIPYSLIALTAMGRWGNFKAALNWTLAKAQGAEVGERPEATYLPFGPLIALSVPCALYTTWLQFF